MYEINWIIGILENYLFSSLSIVQNDKIDWI